MLGDKGSKTLLPQPALINRRHSGISPELCNVSSSPSTPGRCAARLATRPQQFPVQFTALDASHSAQFDAAAAARDMPIRHHLEVLYRTDSCPAACQRLAPQMLSYSSLESVQRRIPSVQMAVMEKEQEKEQNESPSSKLEAAEAKLKQQDYYANVGDAIRTLREEVPLLFILPLSYDIYRDDVVFKDPRNTVRGKKNYQRIFWGVRALGRVAFLRCRLDVQRIWQPDPKCISLKWQFHGVPRIPWEVEGIFDGISQFKLDSDGKIYEHTVTNVVLRDPPLGISPLWNTLARLFAREPQPYPGINFQDPSAEAAAFLTSLAAVEDADTLHPAHQWAEVPLHSLLLSIHSAAHFQQQQQEFLLE